MSSISLQPEDRFSEGVSAHRGSVALHHPQLAEFDIDFGQREAAGRKLEHPCETQPLKLFWPYTISLCLIHFLSLLVFFPSFYSTSGLCVAIAAHVLFDGFGISIGYHRLLTHRGFTCPKWLEHSMAICGICTLQDSPARWVAIHRMHHQHSDHQPDPHSPLVDFFWGHVSWLTVKDKRHDHLKHFERYVRDLLRDPFYLSVEKNLTWLWIYVAHAFLITAAGAAVGGIVSQSIEGSIALAASWFVWGVIARTVFTLHTTWAVNSACHLWGYRNYETRDNSRNTWWVALFTFGEGWHNNHHADQKSAMHGHRWFELDPSWWAIRIMERIGLVSNIVEPRIRTGGEIDEAVGYKS